MSQQPWERPDSVPFPSVWSRFNGCKEIDGVISKFWVQDVAEDQIEDVIGFMQKGFLRDEPLCKHSNVLEDKVGVEDYRRMWRHVLQDRLGLVCYMENSDPNGKPIIVGANCTHLVCKGVPEFPDIQSVKVINIVDTLEYLSKMKDFYKEIGTNSYLGAVGLYVSPEFRGQGVGLELLKAREPLCRAVGIKTTVTAFTAIGSQKLAEKLGYKDLAVMSYDDLRKVNPAFSFPGIEEHTKNLRYMYLSYD